LEDKLAFQQVGTNDELAAVDTRKCTLMQQQESLIVGDFICHQNAVLKFSLEISLILITKIGFQALNGHHGCKGNQYFRLNVTKPAKNLQQMLQSIKGFDVYLRTI
jgi:hypothetical protein